MREVSGIYQVNPEFESAEYEMGVHMPYQYVLVARYKTLEDCLGDINRIPWYVEVDKHGNIIRYS